VDGRPNRRNKAAFSNSSGVSEDGASGFSRSLNLSIDLNGFGNTVEPQFNEVAGNRPNLFVKSRVRYIENFDITYLRGNDQNVRYIEVIVLMIDL